jgi:hypothetical protein
VSQHHHPKEKKRNSSTNNSGFCRKLKTTVHPSTFIHCVLETFPLQLFCYNKNKWHKNVRARAKILDVVQHIISEEVASLSEQNFSFSLSSYFLLFHSHHKITKCSSF